MTSHHMRREDLRLMANLVDWSRVSVQKVFCETFGDILQQKWKEYEAAKQQLRDSVKKNLNCQMPKTPARRNPAAKMREQIRQICWKEVSEEEDAINNNLKEDVVNILEEDVATSKIRDSFLIVSQGNSVKSNLDATVGDYANESAKKLENVSVDMPKENVTSNCKTPVRSITPLHLLPKVYGASPFITFLPLPIRFSSEEAAVENEQNSTYESCGDENNLDILNVAQKLSTEASGLLNTQSCSVETDQVVETRKSSVESVHLMEQPIVAALPVLNLNKSTPTESKFCLSNTSLSNTSSHDLNVHAHQKAKELSIAADPLLNTTFVVDSSQTIGNNSNTNGNYGIHDLDSGDETDNANYPRKQVPHWALAPSIRHSMLQQRIVVDDDSIARHFGNVQMPEVEDIFTQRSSNMNSRREKRMNETTKLEWESPITNPRVGRKTRKGKASWKNANAKKDENEQETL